jgi:alanyl-tRNA synthetase
MRTLSGNEIREMFLRFFESKGHTRVHSSSLVPQNDPTLLFTNAGMNQFKDVFLGLEKRPYVRATSSQKCVRAGGKHNDLENVGFTRRHHTFFEMLGNFSFGDYFKREAIAYAWELVTSPEWFGLPKDKLYVTIFKGENGVARDAEAYQFWLDVGVPKERIFEIGMKDNFWQMGDTGPCGPCSEIFYDMGQAASETPEKDLPFGEDDARYVEIWNLVFMQFDRSADGTLTPLPKPCVDTGAGLERLAAVLQGKLSNFETDLFVPLIARAAELVGSKPTSENPDPSASSGQAVGHPGSSASLRIIADHARAATFLIADGVLPSNEGRGYVLRKILRRGIRHGRLLGQEKPFMFEMVYAVRDEMQGAYPELKDAADRVAKVVRAEEEQFARVIESGSRELDAAFASPYLRRINTYVIDHHAIVPPALTDPLIKLYVNGGTDAEKLAAIKNVVFGGAENPTHIAMLKAQLDGIPRTFFGKDAFHLYETYGLPLDFMVDAARDAGIAFDMEGFE